MQPKVMALEIKYKMQTVHPFQVQTQVKGRQWNYPNKQLYEHQISWQIAKTSSLTTTTKPDDKKMIG